MLEIGLRSWHRDYLPVGKNVLDIGAGNGETAQFYLNHGAEHVICIEPDPELLYKNFGRDKRVTIVPMHVDSIKSNCEGGEKRMVVETHFPFFLKHCGASETSPVVHRWKMEPLPVIGGPIATMDLPHLLRIQFSHFLRTILDPRRWRTS